MSKWTMTQANVGLDVAYKPITILLGDSGRSIRVSDESDETDMANARLIAEAPAMAECLKKCERLAWEIGCYTDDGIHVLHDDERGDLWREISGILERINK